MTNDNTGTANNAPDPTITDPSFFEGGRAIFTVHNDKGVHYTYKIVKKPLRGGLPGFRFFTNVLSGPNNQNDYTYIGLFLPDLCQVRTTNGSAVTQKAPSLVVLNWALRLVKEGKALPAGYGIIHEGKCCVCARPLTDDESIRKGIGPICAAKVASAGDNTLGMVA